MSPANNEYLVIDDFSGHATSFHTHVWDWRPCISFRVVLLASTRTVASEHPSVDLSSCKYIYSALTYCIKNLVNFPVTLRERSKITDRHIHKYYHLHNKISKQQMITNQSTNQAANTYYIDGQADNQKCFYLHPVGNTWYKLIVAQVLIKFLSLMETEGSLTCLQEPITGWYPNTLFL
jgi:hypothetical protein